MSALRSGPGVLILLLAGLVAGPADADPISLPQDGWYRWEVAAGAAGQKACCYNFRSGNIQRVECRLGDSGDGMIMEDDCEVHSDMMQVFVEVSGGRVREIQPLSSTCPVRTPADIRTIDRVSTADSIEWLKAQVAHNPTIADEAVMTLSFHAEREALQALVTILEDSQNRMDAREQALFWMVQSGSDEAFAYLDRLLDG
ncbi:MAG: hypothetical protein R3212_01635 [Xanthomonadales bacterium]|nr:hypothetical protein [Xanthomonadales bacterium]